MNNDKLLTATVERRAGKHERIAKMLRNIRPELFEEQQPIIDYLAVENEQE